MDDEDDASPSILKVPLPVIVFWFSPEDTWIVPVLDIVPVMSEISVYIFPELVTLPVKLPVILVVPELDKEEVVVPVRLVVVSDDVVIELWVKSPKVVVPVVTSIVPLPVISSFIVLLPFSFTVPALSIATVLFSNRVSVISMVPLLCNAVLNP